jgi:DNA-binding GntR family transcriptional regulator
MRTDMFAMRITVEERQLIEALARREERSASDAIRRLIRRTVQNNERAPAAKQGNALVGATDPS